MAMFAKTPSMDDIVDMAHMLILDAIGARLLPLSGRGQCSAFLMPHADPHDIAAPYRIYGAGAKAPPVETP
jgi:2-methylcitrate dehydratase PrpD